MKCQILIFVGLFLEELFKNIDVLDIDAKTETAASSENSGRKSTFQLASDFVTLLQCL